MTIGARHSSREPLRTDQLRPGSPRGAHGPGGHGDGARVRRAGAM